jgi:hypothetical protein
LTLGKSGNDHEPEKHPPRRERMSGVSEVRELRGGCNPKKDHP